MGMAASRPGEHVFTTSHPVQFSPDLLHTLQNSIESDSTRASDLELHMQQRVREELRRSEDAINTTIKDRCDGKDQMKDHDLDPISAKMHDGQTPASQQISRNGIQREIEDLQHRLKQRQLRDNVIKDTGASAAKEKLTRCLRLNDRRPLDCWQEVETFKQEVRTLENDFLGRVLD